LEILRLEGFRAEIPAKQVQHLGRFARGVKQGTFGK
jgi:hypothetical protein